jgi:hypothetical protein
MRVVVEVAALLMGALAVQAVVELEVRLQVFLVLVLQIQVLVAVEPTMPETVLVVLAL